MDRPVSVSSRTTAGAALTGSGALVAVNICAGADAATVTLYDNTAGSGTVICKLGVGIGLSASFCPASPISVTNGIYVALTGTTPQINVAYMHLAWAS